MRVQVEELIASHRPGWTLPQAFYRDAEIFRLDLETIFKHYWLFAGHVSQIPQPGDFFTYQIGDDAIIIIRDESSEAQAIFNVCRHRGSIICSEEAGHTRRLICPYHQWTYSLDGRLISARYMPREFDKSRFSLQRTHIRVLEGLIFISLGEEPPDFEPVALDITPQLSPHELHNAKICKTLHYSVHANWKLIDENARECYHCPGAHPEYCRAVISAAAVNSPHLAAQYKKIQKEREAHWRSVGLASVAKPFRPGNWHSVARIPFRPGVVTQSLDGQPVAPRLGKHNEPDMGVLGIGIYPNFLFQSNSDYAVSLRFTPVGPTRTNVEMSWMVHKDAVEGRDYQVKNIEAVWRATAEQDWTLCENNQRGVNSSQYQPGPYSELEWGCAHFLEWYLESLKADPTR